MALTIAGRLPSVKTVKIRGWWQPQGLAYRPHNGIVSPRPPSSGNSADDDGGGFDIDSYYAATISNSQITGNTAGSGNGGGLHMDGDTTITNSTISGNSAGAGGGIYNIYSVTVLNSTLSGNSAAIGGGIYNKKESRRRRWQRP